MSEKILGQGRKFLSSRIHEGSTIYWQVQSIQCGENRPFLDADVTIRDCSRQIILEFSVHNEEDRKQRLMKMDTLIGELQKMRKCLEEGEF